MDPIDFPQLQIRKLRKKLIKYFDLFVTTFALFNN